MIVCVQITPFNLEIQSILEQFPKYVFYQFCYHRLYPRIGLERGAGWFVLGRPKGSFERRELDSTLVVEIQTPGLI